MAHPLGVNYTYDGDGQRVEKSSGTLYWYGPGGEVLDETDLSGNLTSEYVYFNGRRIARRNASGSVYYYAGDFLGSARAMVTSSGAKCYDADFYPFGGERDITNACPQNYKFTGKERDTETGNDYFGARSYASNFGRFLSPDWSAIPAPVPYANLTNPQTLNLYAIVRDNPETFADLDGHCGQDWTTPCKNNATSVKDKIPATGDGSVKTGDGTQRQSIIQKVTQKAEGAYNAVKGWAHSHPKTVAAISIALQVGLAIATDGGSEAAEGALGAGEAAEGAADAGGATESIADGKITGFTKHGINQVISRDGVGVADRSILDAVKNPTEVVQQSGGRTMYVGKDATVITNAEGKVITTWANGSAGTRIP